MEISFSDLKEKEVVNVYDGRKLGRIIDLLFDTSSGAVQGIVVPGDKKIFRKSDDIFVPLEKLKKIGDDVILIGLQVQENYMGNAYGGYGYMANSYQQNPYSKTKKSKKHQASFDARYQNFGAQNNYRQDNFSQKITNQNQSQANCSYVRFKKIKTDK